MTAFIFKASVKISPLNFRFRFKTCVTILGESEDGILAVESYTGTCKCALITPIKSSLISFLKGYSSIFLNRAFECLMTGKEKCESLSVSPCPGKCFPTAIIPYSCMPCMNAMPFSATSFLSSPKDRIPITGLLMLLLISKTGAKLTCTPICLHCLAISAPKL